MKLLRFLYPKYMNRDKKMNQERNNFEDKLKKLKFQRKMQFNEIFHF